MSHVIRHKADGPFPAHYEPFESPVVNPMFPKVRGNPAARVFGNDMEIFGTPDEFPIVATTYRLTEHFHYWTKNVQINAVLQPESFIELSPELGIEGTPLGWLVQGGVLVAMLAIPVAGIHGILHYGAFDVAEADRGRLVVRSSSTFTGQYSEMTHFVAFTRGKFQGARIAFHSVPTYRDGSWVQPLESVGTQERFGVGLVFQPPEFLCELSGRIHQPRHVAGPEPLLLGKH